MLNAPTVLNPTNSSASGQGLAVVRIVWAEQPASGSLIVLDGSTPITTLTRTVNTPEVSPVTFNPPLAISSGTVSVIASGWFQVLLAGKSCAGGPLPTPNADGYLKGP